jgi:translation initiation factor IF-3
LNEAIQAPQLRVTDADGNQMGVMDRADALRLARDQELDLVEIAPDAKPPVVKIIDWGKYNYQRTKQQQKNRKSAKAQEVKQIRLGLKIGDHDMQVKLGRAAKFLEAGHKVKITLFFRGREMAHKDIGFKLADTIIQQFGDTAVVESQPQLAGKQLSFVVRSNSNAKVKDS